MTNYTIADIDSNIIIDSNTTFGDKVSMSKDGKYLALHLSNTDRTYIYDIHDRDNIKFVNFLMNTENLKSISITNDNDTYKYVLIKENIITDENGNTTTDNEILYNFEFSSDHLDNENSNYSINDYEKITLKGNYVLYEGYDEDNNPKIFLQYTVTSDTLSYTVSSETLAAINSEYIVFAYIYNNKFSYQTNSDFINGVNTITDVSVDSLITKITISDNGDFICILLNNNTIIVYDRQNSNFLEADISGNTNNFTIGNNIDIDNTGTYVSFNIVDENGDSIGVYVYKYSLVSETEYDWLPDRNFDGTIGQNYVQITNSGAGVAFSYSGNNVQFANNYSILQIPITFNIEDVDDPIGIVDSNVTIEVIVNVRTEIDINSVFTFFIIDSNDTITYSISADNIRGTIDLHDSDDSKFYYESSLNDFSEEAITITATDKNGNKTVANLTIAKKFQIVEKDIEIAEDEIFKLSDLFGFNFQNVSNIQTLFANVLIDTNDFNTITYESKFNIVNSEKFINDNNYDTYIDDILLYNNEYIFENTISYSKDKNLIVIGYPYYKKVIIYENGVIFQTIDDPLVISNPITGFGYSVSISEDGSILAISRPNQKTATGSTGRYFVYYYLFNEDEREFQLKTSKVFGQQQHGVGTKIQLLETVNGKVRHILGSESRGSKFRGSVELWEIQENNESLQLSYKGAKVGEKRQKTTASRLGNFAVSKDKKLIIFNSVYFKKLCNIIGFAGSTAYNWNKMQELVILKKNNDIFSGTILQDQKESASAIIDFSQSQSTQTQVTDMDNNTFDVPVEMFYGELSVSNNDRVAIGQYERYDIPFSESSAINYFHNNFDSNQFNDFYDSEQQGLATGICKVVELIYDTNQLDDDIYTSFSNTVNVGSILYGENTEDQFGYKVYLSSQTGKVLFVGAPGYNSNQGKIYIYIYSSNDWQFIGSIIEENSYRLGASFFVNELDDEEILFDVYSASASHEVSDSNNGSNNPEDSNASQFEHKNSHFISRVTIIEDSNMVDTVTADVEIPGNNYIISDSSTLSNNHNFKKSINGYIYKNSLSYSPDENILVMSQIDRITIYYLNTDAKQEIKPSSNLNFRSVTINKAGTYIVIGTSNSGNAIVYKSSYNSGTGIFSDVELIRQESTGSRQFFGYSVEFYQNDDYDEDYLLISCGSAGTNNTGKIPVYNDATERIHNNFKDKYGIWNVEAGFSGDSRKIGNFALGKYMGIGYTMYRHKPKINSTLVYGFSIFFFGRFQGGNNDGDRLDYNNVKGSPRRFGKDNSDIATSNVCINKNGYIDMNVVTVSNSFPGYNTIVFIELPEHKLYVIQNLNYPNASFFENSLDGAGDGTLYDIEEYCDSIKEIGLDGSDYEEAELHLSNDGTILFVSCPNDNKIEIFQYNVEISYENGEVQDDGTWELMRNIQPENTVTVADFGFSMKVYEDDNGIFKIFTRGSPSNNSVYDNNIYVYQLDRSDSNDIIESSIQIDLSLLYYSFPNEIGRAHV